MIDLIVLIIIVIVCIICIIISMNTVYESSIIGSYFYKEVKK